MTKEELREEFNRPSYKQALKAYHGERCVNCGSDDRIEFHHIVPLLLGGTNCITNVVPLCWECHQKAHGATKIKGWKKAGGRPRKDIPNLEDNIQAFIRCEIGSKELKDRCGIAQKSHINDKKTIKEYLHSIGIKKVSNNVDMIHCNKWKNRPAELKIYETHIIYLDGTEEIIHPREEE